MKTAMQELIEYVEELYSKDDILEVIVNKANMLIEKEKEQIIQGHFGGWSDAYDYLKSDGNNRARQAEEYYDETYNQNK